MDPRCSGELLADDLCKSATTDGTHMAIGLSDGVGDGFRSPTRRTGHSLAPAPCRGRRFIAFGAVLQAAVHSNSVDCRIVKYFRCGSALRLRARVTVSRRRFVGSAGVVLAACSRLVLLAEGAAGASGLAVHGHVQRQQREHHTREQDCDDAPIHDQLTSAPRFIWYSSLHRLQGLSPMYQPRRYAVGRQALRRCLANGPLICQGFRSAQATARTLLVGSKSLFLHGKSKTSQFVTLADVSCSKGSQ